MPRRIRVEGSAWILLALLVVLLPLNWVMAAVLAATVHECSHLLVMYALEIPAFEMRIGARGAALDTGPMTVRQELACALAGPVGSFLMLILIHTMPRVALCGLAQGLYNLLPVLPLDGGRCLSSLLYLWVGEDRSNAVMKWIQVFISVCLAAAGIVLQLEFLVGMGGLLGAKLLLTGKRPCKDGQLGVQ